MPSKEIQCQFCDKKFNKVRLAVHVKSKHINEISAKLLSVAGNKLFNPIRSFAKGCDIMSVPFYPDESCACYWFGIVPKYFEEEDSYSDYIHNQENMIEHKRFLEECIKKISLHDYIIQYNNLNRLDLTSFKMSKDSEIKYLEDIIIKLREKLEKNELLNSYTFNKE